MNKRAELLLRIRDSLKRLKRAREQAYNWDLQSRPEQRLPQGNWRVWLILAGRGFGKTRAGAEAVRRWIERGEKKRICLAGASLEETRRVMIEGPSGLLRVSPSYAGLRYLRSHNQIQSKNQALVQFFSGCSPERLRGPQFDGAWIDELCKFPDPEAFWDQLMMTIRLGPRPQVIITTTPRPSSLLDRLLNEPGVIVTRGSTFENAANLSPDFLESVRARYAGTSWGLQELEGKVLHNREGALWRVDMLSSGLRWPLEKKRPDMRRIVVAIDPAVTSRETSDETGLIVAGRDFQDRFHILADASGKMAPLDWAERAFSLYKMYEADCLVAEVNNGGDLVTQMLRTVARDIPCRAVRAMRGKVARAEPAAALYQQHRVFHHGEFSELNTQLLNAGKLRGGYDDRCDALVWALTALQDEPETERGACIWDVEREAS